jgi:hypothetical protein
MAPLAMRIWMAACGVSLFALGFLVAWRLMSIRLEEARGDLDLVVKALHRAILRVVELQGERDELSREFYELYENPLGYYRDLRAIDELGCTTYGDFGRRNGTPRDGFVTPEDVG